MNTWKENLEETKQHYIDWWNHKGIVLNMWEHFQEGVRPHADIPAPADPGSLHRQWFDPEWRSGYLDWYVAHSSLKADMLPVANTQLGPGSLAAILGGVFEGGPDTIWIHPDPEYKDDFSFDENHPNWILHKELLKAVKAKAAGHYYVGMPDLMEGLDVLAAMKGTDKVLLDTVMQPEVLERQMQLINDIYFRVFDELYEIIREDDEMAFCYFSSWAPGKMTKIQSDISTMISVPDYRRFVQPFIREQCRKIEYTLYHLDGVGALHHLPAILEVEELNAIQWTPGVGQPQGGSPKWYDLYRRILDAGKSIMACWVTLDELRPLLDNIGGNGVHLEMDFHNEDEVEQAMKIVEEYRDRPAPCLRDADAIVVSGADIFDADREVMRIIDMVESESDDSLFSDGRLPEKKQYRSTGAPVIHGVNCDCCLPSATPSAGTVYDAIVEGNADKAAAATAVAVENGEEPQAIINGQMISAMAEVGRRFQDGKAFVPQLLMAGRAMKAALEILKPMLAGGSISTLGKVVIGTVKGDLHDIGKNLVASMLEGCGFEVINIGIDVDADTFVENVREYQPDILCMSALLTTTMTYMKDVIDSLTSAGLRDKVKVMVGGAPVSQGFADEIGADGYSDNANTAVALAKSLVGA
ncbi:MAG: corrinoid protein [Muribaculaceae bacterium]|nr:corrinoid protein [Muribaculaceae bacterium]